MLPDIFVVEEGVACFNRQPAFAVHRVASVDREVQNRIFQLIWVDEAVPQSTRDYRLDFDLTTQGATKHLIHASNQTTDVHHSRLQRLSPREGEQLGGKFRTAGQPSEHDLDQNFAKGIAKYSLGH